MDEGERHNVESKKPDTEEHMCHSHKLQEQAELILGDRAASSNSLTGIGRGQEEAVWEAEKIDIQYILHVFKNISYRA